MEKPIIGILGNTYKTQPGLFSSAERMYVNSDYIEGVLNNGGIPMAIPAVAMKADPEGILAVCDGILVPGGEDLNPWYYDRRSASPRRCRSGHGRCRGSGAPRPTALRWGQ